MKLLLLSTATGQGHNSASDSIKEYLDSKGCETLAMDVLKCGKKNTSLRASRLYTYVTVYLPDFFGLIYRLGDFISSSRRRSPVFYLNSLYAGSLYKKITDFKPDVIVCTHLFGAQAVTYIREKYGLRIPAVGIMTDYVCIPFWEETRLDKYIIPARELVGEFVKKGIPEEKIVPIGIPVKARFKNSGSKQEARAKFNLSGGHVFAIMGGSMGFGRIVRLSTELLRAVPDAKVAVVCGSNKNLYKKLCGIKNVFAFEYIDNVNELMDAADVLLTKPGGLSSTEAAVKRVPIVFTSPIPGCEEKNAEFLCRRGMAVSAGNVDKAVAAASRLLFDPAAVNKMLDAQKRYISGDAAEKIGDFLLGLLRQ